MTSEVDLTGRTLGHYRIVERIGAGGMGVVYRAEDTHLDRSVAVKVLSADAVADPDRKRRFAQEARSASALNHANIIHIYDIDTAEGTDFIAMEFVRGKTLDHVIGRDGLDTRQAVKCAVQIADALCPGASRSHNGRCVNLASGRRAETPLMLPIVPQASDAAHTLRAKYPDDTIALNALSGVFCAAEE